MIEAMRASRPRLLAAVRAASRSRPHHTTMRNKKCRCCERAKWNKHSHPAGVARVVRLLHTNLAEPLV